LIVVDELQQIDRIPVGAQYDGQVFVGHGGQCVDERDVVLLERSDRSQDFGYISFCAYQIANVIRPVKHQFERVACQRPAHGFSSVLDERPDGAVI